jgi:hypothetical protein
LPSAQNYAQRCEYFLVAQMADCKQLSREFEGFLFWLQSHCFYSVNSLMANWQPAMARDLEM